MRIESLLRSLDRKTRKKARMFLISPFFNSNQLLVDCYDCLVNYVDRDQRIDKRLVWKKLHGSDVYSDAKIRKHFYDLTQLLRLFFAVETTINNEHYKRKSEIDFCKNHNIIELHNKYSAELRENIDSTQSSSESLFDLYFSIRDVGDLLEDSKDRDKGLKEEKIFDNLTLQKSILNTAYLTEIIRMKILKKDHDSILGIIPENAEEQIHEHIRLDHIEQDILPNDLLLIYQKIFNSISIKNERLDIRSILDTLRSFDIKGEKEIKFLYGYLNNYLTRQINAGQNLYEELFMLYKFGLDGGHIMRVNQIDAVYYENIVFVACRLKEFEWALDFVDDYKDYLSTEYRKTAYSFSKARIFRSMERYGDLVETLRNVEYEDITYNLNSRLMLIMAFYELDEYDTLDSVIKAFKIFLRRRRNISTSRKNNFRDFCDVVYNLVLAGERRDPERIKKAKEIISGNPGISSSWWLEEKIAEVSAILGLREDIVQPQDS